MAVTIRAKNFQSIKDCTVEVDRFSVVTGTNNSGKALAHGTLVATPEGWVPVEQVTEGQEVLAGDGTPTLVTGVFPQGERSVCAVLFDDGRQLVTDQDHQWQVSIGSRRFPNGGGEQHWEVLTTRQIRDRVGDNPSKFSKPAIPVSGPAEFGWKELPLDPYLLGLLLGDGSFRGPSPRISTKDPEVLAAVARLVPSGVQLNKCGKYDYRLATTRGHSNPVLSSLRALGLGGCLSHQKRIPPLYLVADVSQRLSLLQGLLDTDGSVNKQGVAEFYSASLELAEGVRRLVWSLGGTVRRRRKSTSTYKYKGSVRQGRESFTVTLRLPEKQVFRLPRKAALLGPCVRRVQPLMVAFRDVGTAFCTCLSVAHPSALFQVQGHLVTHNTALQRAARGVFQNTPGTAFIREGETTCSVEVDFGKDGKVRWEKGTGKRDRPTYIINDGEPIYPGASVPDEVAAFGVVPIQVGGQEVWPTVAPQFTGQIFLLDRPGSALAEAVADVERVGQLNRALRASESDKRQASAALKVRQVDLAKHEAEVARFEGLDAALAAVQALEGQRNQVVTVGRAVERLTDLRDRLKDAKRAAARLAPVNQIMVPSAEEARQLGKELEELRGLKARLESTKAVVAKYEGIQGVLVECSEEPAERVLAALDILIDLRERLNRAQRSVVDRDAELKQAEQEHVQAVEAADALLGELGTCPTCGTSTEALHGPH